MSMQIAKWGNSLAIRIPATVVAALGLKEGDDIQVRVAEARTFEISRTPDTKALLDRLRKYRGRLPEDFQFDRLQANEQD
ncbi:MAG: AbrB/MazE/SpoVT family DNA-binding domain-containing protein [Pseudomonadales bacterium]|jgi:antitoxin MazE